MKIAFAIVALLLFQTGVCAQAPATDGSAIFATYPKLADQVKEFGESYVSKDFERTVQLTWPKYVESYGREKLAATYAETPRELEALGVQLFSWAPTEAKSLVEHDGSLYVVVPTVLKYKRADQITEAPLTLIAISRDNGEHWTFISTNCVNVKRAFPAIADKLDISTDSARVVYIK